MKQLKKGREEEGRKAPKLKQSHPIVYLERELMSVLFLCMADIKDVSWFS